MKKPGRQPLHALLVLTERPGDWRPWKVVAIGTLLVVCTGLLWGWLSGTSTLVWGIALPLLCFAGADWALLSALPRKGLSFGAVQPPWLALSILRCAMGLAALPLAPRWPFAALSVTVLVQALILGLMAYGTLVEPFRLRLSSVEVLSPKLSNPGKPLRIVQLSDLHVERLTRREATLLARLAELAPDLILLTGDYLNTSYNDDPRALAELRQFLIELRALSRIYAVWGTAEVDLPSVLRPVFDELGIALLEDQAVALTVRGHRLWLIGMLCRRDLEAGGDKLRELLSGISPDAFTLLLHHSPDLTPQAAALGVDLVLAGHTHGGQWCIPGFGALWTSSRYWKRYESGERLEAGTRLYVSRGLGMEGYGAPRARFFCPPEIVSITLAGVGKAA